MLLAAFAGAIPVAAESGRWVRGAAKVLTADPGIRLQEVGGASMESAEMELPRFVTGMFALRSEGERSVHLRTSNLIRLHWTGPGYFGMERFDQFIEAPGEAEGRESGFSRMIMNLRNGRLIVDSRPLSATSQLVLETPVGRITAAPARWASTVSYDEGSRLYNFTIECLGGTVRFADRRGRTFDLRGGQRLSGVGPAGTLAIEVGELSEEVERRIAGTGIDEGFDDFAKTALREFEALLPALERRARPTPLEETPRTAEGSGPRARRLIIEYAAPPSLLMPFRGEVVPPSEFQSDLF